MVLIPVKPSSGRGAATPVVTLLLLVRLGQAQVGLSHGRPFERQLKRFLRPYCLRGFDNLGWRQEGCANEAQRARLADCGDEVWGVVAPPAIGAWMMGCANCSRCI